jgi:hypothetical protein
MIEFFKEYWEFLKVRKKFWLLPIIFILLLFGVAFISVQGTSVAPVLYTIF